MTPRFIVIILTFYTFSISTVNALGSFSDKLTNGQSLNPNDSLKFDTSKTVIIKFDKRDKWLFDSTFSPAELTQQELQSVDNFLLACVTNYNNSLDNEHKQWGIDLTKKNYRKQLIVVTNKVGQKEIWVNCLCWVRNDKWKTEIIGNEDGGNCYFNFKINLTTKKYYALTVNGK